MGGAFSSARLALRAIALLSGLGGAACEEARGEGSRTPAHPEARVAAVWPAAEPVSARPGRPRVPVEIHESAGASEASPGIRLRRVLRADHDWRAHRALIEEEGTQDVRAYAVGDLLPRGAILVGIEREAVRVFTAEAMVLRLDLRGGEAVIEDLRGTPRRRVRARPRPRPTEDVGPAVAAAVRDLGAPDPDRVRGAIEALLGPGEILVPSLVLHVADPAPVALPAAEIRGRPVRAQTRGDRVVGILEAITGQSFGDPTEPGARPGVVAAWRRFAGS